MAALTLGTASIAAAASGFTCSKLTGTATGSKGTVTGCTDTANTGGSGTFDPSALLEGGPITWKGTGSTTINPPTLTTITPDKCPKGSTEYEINATLGASTGKAMKSIKSGWTLTAYVCVTSTNKFSLLKGTKLEVGPKF